MPHPHPARPPYPPYSGGVPGESDESLAAQLRGRPEGETGPAVALLTARHWQATHEYAVICLATSAPTSSMVTAAAFHQVLERVMRAESAVALRPRFLVAVRDIVKDWSADDRITDVLPDLTKPAGGRGMRAAKSMTPENRKLAERAFQALPGLAQCLLWHTEVEADPANVPAELLGMDTNMAAASLEQAREQFREGCVRAHREFAPSKECRFYNRLLDVPIRRGGALLPDVQQHLAECHYCRYAAEQLSQVESGLGTLLAEAVLGWGARRYLDSRPGRGQSGTRARGHGRHGGSGRGASRDSAGGRGAGRGRPNLLSRMSSPRRPVRGGTRNRKTLFTSVGLASVVVLAVVLGSGLWPKDGSGADPTASSSATGGRAPVPGASPTPPAVSSSPPATDGNPTATRHTRLRNVTADLCLDIRGGKATAGAATRLAPCSTAWTQMWTYEDDGLLRSVANPGLCLDSHADAGVVILGRCAAASAGRGDDVRYDLTVRGELLPRWEEGLAVAPASDDPNTDVVVKVRDGSAEQRWLTDPVTASPESLSIGGPRGKAAQVGADSR
ncbi:RICIN domain-containing protein [Streptomyces turgidiscabies]|uniref:Ricin-type beta-trefoil lectin domain protein n=2 Tax=Streptomyces TaxID=1883 RepID=L7F675_STRT8|nr:RICIN domain-containing protein [Streptomyces turgidiscabies]ELP66812.1 ricin-type beta-trefoil lectin domain protein [Streptomyces turgidiscabies Car8]MDX3491830.1 RICIN domain-containing protein [Streptomyces turgidiscabies]GAQ72054.1 ricin-type beta-trefoil lectin domain protein [Streptomyces turgidiscabies]